MQIGWVDFSKDERNKVLNVINLLDEPGAVDELGLGIIRDAFSDYFFPGTSTVQTRAKYFLVVPYILKEAGSGMYGENPNEIIRRIDEEERHCRDLFLKHSVDGVIGRRNPSGWVLRTPMNIYWNGIKKLDIFRSNLSVYEYIRYESALRNSKKLKNYGHRVKETEDSDIDDNDAGDFSSFQFWNLGVTYSSDWRNDLTIDLRPDEASFLKERIITSQRNSLFAHLLINEVPLDRYESFGALTAEIISSVDEDLRFLIMLANDFNNLVSIVTTRYNLIVSQDRNSKALEQWDLYSKDIERRSSVDLNSIYARLRIKNSSLKVFLKNVQKALIENDIEEVDRLIIKREIENKDRSRAKVLKAGEYNPDVWIGLDVLDYRFHDAKRIIKDIVAAEEI